MRIDTLQYRYFDFINYVMPVGEGGEHRCDQAWEEFNIIMIDEKNGNLQNSVSAVLPLYLHKNPIC